MMTTAGRRSFPAAAAVIWALNADGQSRMLLAAMQGEIAEQYPGGDERRESEIEAGAARPARLIFSDARTAIDQIEGVWRRMPPGAFVDLMLPRIMPALATRLTEDITVQVETIDRDRLVTAATASITGDPVIVRGSASAILCWLLGRVFAAAADLDVTRCGQPWPLPQLRAWA